MIFTVSLVNSGDRKHMLLQYRVPTRDNYLKSVNKHVIVKHTTEKRTRWIIVINELSFNGSNGVNFLNHLRWQIKVVDPKTSLHM